MSCSRLTADDADISQADGSGNDGGNGGGPFIGGVGALHFVAGLSSAVPADESLLLEWQSRNLEGFELEAAVFVSESQELLYDADPIMVSLASEATIVGDLVEGTRYFVGLGIREGGELPSSGSLPFEPSGPVLDVRLASPIYANPDADAAIADGLTPETAYPNLFLAVLRAWVVGAGQGGNVWVSGGVFADASVTLLEGVDLYGGFTPSFELATRDLENNVTTLEGLAADGVIRVEAQGDKHVIDGFVIDGLGASATGFDLDRTPLDLRSCIVRGCSRGIRARSTLLTRVIEVELTACRFEDNDVEGVSFDGAFNIRIDDSVFAGNGQEGLEFGPWVAPSGVTVTALVRDSSFLGNGAEGLDFDLAAPDGGGSPGGQFAISIEDCDFEQNRTIGLLIDIDFESTPEWSAEITLRGCSARANGTHGCAFDMDADASCVIHRLLSTANGADGLSFTSESHRGQVTVSTSAFVANLGAGLRSSAGNLGVAASHCLFAGNVEAGFSAESAQGLASSCIAYLQPNAFMGTRLRGSISLDASPLPFLYAATEFHTVTAQLTDALELEGLLEAGVGSVCEVAADSSLRFISAVGVGSVVVAPAPVDPPLPTTLAIFPGTDSVIEDYELSENSAARGAGMMQPNGMATDAGLFGWIGGGIPGAENLVQSALFAVARSTPAWGAPIDSTEDFIVAFSGGGPQSSLLAAALRLVDADGDELPLLASVADGLLILAPPAGGWVGGELLELHATLLSAEGDQALVPTSLPIGQVGQ